jgi:nucleoside-diphosphate-sugar epimerase
LPVKGNYKFLEDDITKLDLHSLLLGVHVVIHLAAITDAAASFGNAELVENNNYYSTKRLAEACALKNVRLITLSSTSVYGTQAEVVDESCSQEELQPQSPYAVTKLKEERLVNKLVKDNGLKACIFRFGTIFGDSPGMRFHTAVNKFCWQVSLEEPITVWTTAYNQKRPYLDLGDACDAIVHILRNDSFDGRTYNVLTQNATVSDIVEIIREFKPDLKVIFVDNKIMNQLSYEVSCERFKSLKFTFNGDLKKGIGSTLELIKHANGD